MKRKPYKLHQLRKTYQTDNQKFPKHCRKETAKETKKIDKKDKSSQL